MKNEKILTSLTIHALKELGEIAEVLVRKNRPDHWKNELGDLCGLCIKPMLDLAGMTFGEACALGVERKNMKMSILIEPCHQCSYTFCSIRDSCSRNVMKKAKK